MKVLICIHNLANGGAERVASLWAKGFVNYGHIVNILTCDNTPQDYFIPDGVKVYYVHSSGNLIRRNIQRFRLIRSLIKDFNPAVIITVLFPWNIWVPFATLGLNIPIINTEHDSFERPQSAPMSKKQKFEKFYLNRIFSKVTLLNNADSRAIGRSLKNTVVLPNPLSFVPLQSVPTKEKKILAAGRLDYWHYKGFDVLIKAWAKIASKYPDWVLEIAGSGGDESIEYLQSLINENNINGQTRLLGFQKDIIDYYRRSSVFVLSSRYEGFGMVLIEAMSQGCACVACDYKGRQKEIITNENQGLLCMPDNVDDLSLKIDMVVSDSKLREALQQKAIERSHYYCIDNIMQMWNKILIDIKLK